MALTDPTLLDTAGANSGSHISSISTSTIAPSGDALLELNLALLHTDPGAGGGDASPTITVENTLTGTGEWTVVEGEFIDDGTHRHHVFYAYAKAGSSPGSGTITVNISDPGTTPEIKRAALVVGERTGQDTTTPVVEQVDNSGSTGTNLSTSLTGIDSGNKSSGLGCFKEDTPTAGTDNTLLAAASSGGGSRVEAGFVYGSTVTRTWESLTEGNPRTGTAIEIAEAGGGFAHSQAVIIG